MEKYPTLYNDFNYHELVRHYLERIKIKKVEKPSYSLLKMLQHNHLLTVPFENLDIVNKQMISLDITRIYEKIVLGRRGGFCYELNGIFGWLLRKLNFKVSLVSGRVYDAANDRFGPEFDHMVLLAYLEKTYLIDVGVGDSFRKPIEMPNGIVEDISGTYRIRYKRESNNKYFLQKLENYEWRPVYSFTIYPKKMSDFTDMCVYHQTSVKSPFKQGPFCTIATECGRLTLSANSLTITEHRKKQKIPVSSTKEYRQMLHKYFGVEFRLR